jgi:hypothetical protein
MDEYEWDDLEPEDHAEMEAEFDDAMYEGYQMSDAEADADTLASAGWGTDEDYGFFGDESFDDGGW